MSLEVAVENAECAENQTFHLSGLQEEYKEQCHFFLKKILCLGSRIEAQRSILFTKRVGRFLTTVKERQTQEQKNLTNRAQKAENVKGAFSIPSPELVSGRTLLLIDDIYDSGYMLREVGITLMRAGAKLVYPLTITRT